jgi:hypothetical protein
LYLVFSFAVVFLVTGNFPAEFFTMAPQVYNGVTFEDVRSNEGGTTASLTPVQPAEDGDGTIFISIPTFRGT